MDYLEMPILVYIFYLTLGLTGFRTASGCSLPLSSGCETEDFDIENPSPEEGSFFEGDIVTGSEVIPIVEFKPAHRNLAANPRLLWPKKTLYYEFSAGQFRGELRALVEEALMDIMKHSCVKFSPRVHQTTYLKLKGTGEGCNSKVGYQEEEGPLTLQIAGQKCYTLGTVQHEFLHALGLWHEHTRADRDDFITVVWENVRSDRKSNFVKRSDKESEELLKLPYDYGSIMHYKRSSFTKHKGSSTLVPTHKDGAKVMGQRLGITKGDIAKLNRLYNCTGKYYIGKDLEGKRFLLGQYYKVGDYETTRDSKKDFDFGDDTKGIQRISGVASESTHKQTLAAFKDMHIDKRGNIKSQNNNSYVSKEGNRRVNDIDKVKPHLQEEVTGETSLGPNKNIGRYGFKTLPSTTHYLKPINVNKSKDLLDNLGSYFDENESRRQAITDKVVLETKKNMYEYEQRRKRETVGTKSQRDGKPDMTDQQSKENHESFTPQKILPELLKGVLSTDNDRPIVIQFAIYQPIVYKSSNQSEPSSEEEKDVGSSDEGRNKEHRGRERKGHEARNGEEKGDNSNESQDTKRLASSQKTQEFYHEHEDGSRLLSKNIFAEQREHEEDDDRMDVRSFTDRGSGSSEQRKEHNRRTEEDYELLNRRKQVQEKNDPEHQTEYIPHSDDHDITVSKKEYILSPHDSHMNGKELRVSQTDYTIQAKNSRNHDSEFPLHSGHSSRSEVPVKGTEVDRVTSSDGESLERSYSHEGMEYLDKTHIQPLKTSHRETGYDPSSLVSFSEGKGTKSTYERQNDNNYNHKPNDQDLSYKKELGSSQPSPLQSKQEEHHGSLHDFQERNYKVASKYEHDDIAPDFHESSIDDPIIPPTHTQNLTQFNSEPKKDNIHADVDYHMYPSGEVLGDYERHTQVADVKSAKTYDPKYLDTVSESHPPISGHALDEIVDHETVEDKKEDDIIDRNKSFETSRGTNDREIRPSTVLKSPRTRNEDVLSLNTRSSEPPSRSTGKGPLIGKKEARPDIVVNEDFSSELDIIERRKKLERNDRNNDFTLDVRNSKQPEPALPNAANNVKNKNRIQSNIKSTVVRKKLPNSQTEPVDQQQDLFDERDLISKPKSSQLNLNPRQALPLKASIVNMGRRTQ